ncbi:MAG: hypothetical protein ABIK96_00850 [bacterium]
MNGTRTIPFARLLKVHPRHRKEAPVGLHPALEELCRLRREQPEAPRPRLQLPLPDDPRR